MPNNWQNCYFACVYPQNFKEVDGTINVFDLNNNNHVEISLQAYVYILRGD
jgi:hypothetical protein